MTLSLLNLSLLFPPPQIHRLSYFLPHLKQGMWLRTKSEFEGDTVGMGEGNATGNSAGTWVLFMGCWAPCGSAARGLCHFGRPWEGKNPHLDHSTNIS